MTDMTPAEETQFLEQYARRTKIEQYVTYLLATACEGTYDGANADPTNPPTDYSFTAVYERDAYDVARGVEKAANLNTLSSESSGQYEAANFLRDIGTASSTDDFRYAKQFYQNKLSPRVHMFRQIIELDTWDILSRAEAEIPALLAALRDGKIDGGNYFGECACLVGTIAKAKLSPAVPAVEYININGDSRDLETQEYKDPIELLGGILMDVERPAESWVLNIDVGDNTSNSLFAWSVEQMVIKYARSRGIMIAGFA